MDNMYGDGIVSGQLENKLNSREERWGEIESISKLSYARRCEGSNNIATCIGLHERHTLRTTTYL